jgi:hypothetical protein
VAFFLGDPSHSHKQEVELLPQVKIWSGFMTTITDELKPLIEKSMQLQEDSARLRGEIRQLSSDIAQLNQLSEKLCEISERLAQSNKRPAYSNATNHPPRRARRKKQLKR